MKEDLWPKKPLIANVNFERLLNWKKRCSLLSKLFLRGVLIVYPLCDGVDSVIDLEPLVWRTVILIKLFSNVGTDVAKTLLDDFSSFK